MKQVSTGVGLCVLGLCIVGYPMAERLASRAEAGVPSAAVTVVAASAAQAGPTLVWYGVLPAIGISGTQPYHGLLFRAWSDGTVEALAILPSSISAPSDCDYNWAACGWRVVSAPNQGLNAAADLNFDQAVDGVDLGMLLAKWGPAPSNPVPPSDCPLALINP